MSFVDKAVVEFRNWQHFGTLAGDFNKLCTDLFSGDPARVKSAEAKIPAVLDAMVKKDAWWYERQWADRRVGELLSDVVRDGRPEVGEAIWDAWERRGHPGAKSRADLGKVGIFLRTGELDEATRLLTGVMNRKDPDWAPIAAHRLGDLSLDKGELSRAKRYYEQCIKLVDRIAFPQAQYPTAQILAIDAVVMRWGNAPDGNDPQFGNFLAEVRETSVALRRSGVTLTLPGGHGKTL